MTYTDSLGKSLAIGKKQVIGKVPFTYYEESPSLNQCGVGQQ